MGKEKVNKGRIAYYEGLTEKRGDRIEWTGKVNFVPEALQIPLKRKKHTTYFVNSMSDLFHENVTDEQIDQIFAVMALAPQHIFQILTKRPKRMYEYIANLEERRGDNFINWWTKTTDKIYDRLPEIFTEKYLEVASQCKILTPLPNVWLGTSIENQKAADDRLPWLVKTPAAVRFISAEPLLEEIDLRDVNEVVCYLEKEIVEKGWDVKKRGAWEDYEFLHDIHWIIAGSESGTNARPMNEDWVRSLRDQCVETDTAFFYKQKATAGGKKISMPELDGKIWAEMPKTP